MMTLIDGPILIKSWIGSVRSWAGKYKVMNSKGSKFPAVERRALFQGHKLLLHRT